MTHSKHETRPLHDPRDVAWVFYRRAQYRNKPWWSRAMHRLAHTLGWNLCATVAGGYRCVVCGDTRNWK